MKIDGGFEYPGAPLADVFAMLIDPEFQRRRCAATGALESGVEVTGDPAAPLVRCRRRMATAGLPDFVRKIVGSTLEVIDELQWRPATAPDGRDADVRLSFAGQPTRMTGALAVRQQPAGTHGTLTAELKAGIPLLGGKVEQATAPFILKAMTSEEVVGRQWLNK